MCGLQALDLQLPLSSLHKVPTHPSASCIMEEANTQHFHLNGFDCLFLLVNHLISDVNSLDFYMLMTQYFIKKNQMLMLLMQNSPDFC